ncbi:MAG TPA: amidohydrolase family protein [Chthoniobacterales bacterium]|jgi:cytosine/adenosine deaminase-related metal-dependent hydrolase
MPTFRAHTIVTMTGPPIDNGAVAIEGDRIAAVGPFQEIKASGGELQDLGEVVLLPGLINAHCHLDFTSLCGMIAPQRSFADWIRQINHLRRQLSDDDYLRSIATGFAESRRWGTTTIANIESLPHLLERMPRPLLRTWWFAELIDVQPRGAIDKMIDDALAVFRGKENWPGGFGLSPHAPYTASSRLLRAATRIARRRNLPLTIHLGESREEMEMFRHGSGSLFDLLRSLGRPLDDCSKRKTPLGIMLDMNILDERWIVVHSNELTEEDFDRLETGPRFHVAHCPRSGRYFNHSPFPLRRLRELDFNIALGTDSLASNSSLSLFAEMQTVRNTHPWLTPKQILEMATINGARALGQERSLGKIAPGLQADLIALPIANQSGDLFEKIIAWDQAVPSMMAAGCLATTTN